MSRAKRGVMSAFTHMRLMSYAATPSGWFANSWAWRLKAPVPVVIVEYGIRAASTALTSSRAASPMPSSDRK
jgi:hypothetical protein